ncbi:hypothetical protein DFH07DRAFT_1035941 [Mycena maculata]|uniref:Zn(2)-C6 fungal-type domain-containing protein n=1 Tax=Mycena maculata TaxID=230809 RepID=A0AAD7N6Z7_9AGAR|nr:hypothetical protein DFH07DRAFT_1035941 [Mycena maculata]
MTSKQACNQCAQSSLPYDGNSPCSKCISRKMCCTFVKFHHQAAPVGLGHPPRSVDTHTLPSLSSLPSLLGLASGSGSLSSSVSSSSSLLSVHGAHGLTLTHPSHGLVLAGLGHLQGQGQPALSANSPHPPLSHPHEPPPPFLYAQQAASGGGGAYVFPSSARDGGDSSTSSPTSGYAEYNSYGGGERRLPSRDSVYYPCGDYLLYLPNGHRHGRHHASASLDLQHPDMQGQRGEFLSAFGLMSLDDPNVLAGLAADGLPFFAQPAHSHANAHHMAQGRPQNVHTYLADGEKCMQLVQPLAYQINT